MQRSRGTSVSEKIFASLAAAVLSAGPAAAQCGPPEEPAPQARESVLVSPAWLAARLADPSLLVLHVDHDRAEYERGHVPRARYVPAEAFYNDPDVELPRPAQLDSLLGALAIGPATRVVIVPGSAMMAARAFVALEFAGLRGRVHWLDGGTTAWRAAGRRLSTEAPPAIVPRRFTARMDSSVVVTGAWLRGRLTDRRVALLDTRSRGEYTGDGRDVLPRYGHVPGARWLEWSRLLSDPAAGMHGAPPFAEPAVLRRLLAEAGAGDGAVLVPYCTVGLRASVVYVAARSLGLEVRLYDGSMAEWTRHADYPLIRGDQR